jgi:hypothetical protein
MSSAPNAPLLPHHNDLAGIDVKTASLNMMVDANSARFANNQPQRGHQGLKCLAPSTSTLPLSASSSVWIGPKGVCARAPTLALLDIGIAGELKALSQCQVCKDKTTILLNSNF